eukprot:2913180-Rhodomonas_salina.2
MHYHECIPCPGVDRSGKSSCPIGSFRKSTARIRAKEAGLAVLGRCRTRTLRRDQQSESELDCLSVADASRRFRRRGTSRSEPRIALQTT